jgi:hypothetical protein
LSLDGGWVLDPGLDGVVVEAVVPEPGADGVLYGFRGLVQAGQQQAVLLQGFGYN